MMPHHTMSPQQFEARLNYERSEWSWLRTNERVFMVERRRPKLAPAFAQGLILDMTIEQARLRVRRDPEGAAGFDELLTNIFAGYPKLDIAAAQTPSDDLTPFFALCSLVLAQEREDWDLPDGPRHDGSNSDGPPRLFNAG